MNEVRFPLLTISRLRIGIDGKGVTSLVSGAGCPLRCHWCINKELLAKAKATGVTAEELYEKVRIDDLYFRSTGGGITFGGGESLLHAKFYPRFREICNKDWYLNAETSLAVPRENVEIAAGCISEFIVDCKETDPQIYRDYTGGEENLMEENLRYLLDTVGSERIIVRVPLIPEYNTKNDRAQSVSRLKEMGVTRLDVFEYLKEKPRRKPVKTDELPT